jgi:hypothetical protein
MCMATLTPKHATRHHTADLLQVGAAAVEQGPRLDRLMLGPRRREGEQGQEAAQDLRFRGQMQSDPNSHNRYHI